MPNLNFSPNGPINPKMPVKAYRTYSLRRPLGTHFRKGTCSEDPCTEYLAGWTTVIDPRDQRGAAAAHYIEHDRSRKHVKTVLPDGRWSYWFEPGQEFFASDDHQHYISLERDPFAIIRDGDHRGNDTGRVERVPVSEWVNRFEDNQGTLKDAADRG